MLSERKEMGKKEKKKKNHIKTKTANISSETFYCHFNW
jgi:hypothetical protein